MVKGTARSIIIVKTPDPAYFEEAIFIVKDGAGVTGDEVIVEAQKAAEEYLRSEGGARPLPPIFFTLLGAAAMGLIWAVTAIIM